MADAGIGEPLYSWILGAKGLTGHDAMNYLSTATSTIKRTKITRKQQHDLFIPIYNKIKDKVIEISQRSTYTGIYGPFNWSAIDSRIQDIAVDLIYRGDYHSASRQYVQEPISRSDISRMRNVMADQAKWPNVPADIFQRRVNYLTMEPN